MMNVYLASRYSRRLEMLEAAKKLESIGYRVTCRWIQGNHQISDSGLNKEEDRKERERFALEDFDDLCQSDIVISFTEEPRAFASRGGRHVELGIALGLRKLCYVVGPRENIFHCLQHVRVFDSFESLLKSLPKV